MRLAAAIIVTSITCLLCACTKVEHLQQAAESGDARAALVLGYAYENGTEGLQRDYGAAKKWFEAAAERGEPYADCALGALYHRGLAVSKDNEMAVKWYFKAHVDGASSLPEDVSSRAAGADSHADDVSHEADRHQLEPLLRAALDGDYSAVSRIYKIDLRLWRELSLSLRQ